jgi:hypothetical protein
MSRNLIGTILLQNLSIWPPKQSTFLILPLAVVLGELPIVASLCAISSAFHVESLCNSATTYAELAALRERVVVKALYY